MLPSHSASKCFHCQKQSSVSIGKWVPLCNPGNWGLPIAHTLLQIFLHPELWVKTLWSFWKHTYLLDIVSVLTIRIATIQHLLLMCFVNLPSARVMRKEFYKDKQLPFEASESHQMKAKVASDFKTWYIWYTYPSFHCLIYLYYLRHCQVWKLIGSLSVHQFTEIKVTQEGLMLLHSTRAI